jgi:exodeoxyribonuclease VII small subunit
MTAQRRTVEQALTRLQKIIDAIRDVDTPIEKSIELYREGAELCAFCSEKLSGCGAEIMTISETLDHIFEEKPFEYADGEGCSANDI